MAKKKSEKFATEESIVALEGVLSKGEKFIEDNQNIIGIVVAAVVLVVLGFMGYQKFIVKPQEEDAKNAMFMAEKYFEKDSLDLALYGDDLNLGFIDIIDEYKVTNTSDLAKYYAGICFFKKKEYEESLKYFNDFAADDVVLQCMANGAKGDSYLQLGEMDKAIQAYLQAADESKSDFLSPAYLQKAAWVYEMQEDWDNALKTFERIKTEYSTSSTAREINKNIERAKIKLGQ